MRLSLNDSFVNSSIEEDINQTGHSAETSTFDDKAGVSDGNYLVKSSDINNDGHMPPLDPITHRSIMPFSDSAIHTGTQKIHDSNCNIGDKDPFQNHRHDSKGYQPQHLRSDTTCLEKISNQTNHSQYQQSATSRKENIIATMNTNELKLTLGQVSGEKIAPRLHKAGRGPMSRPLISSKQGVPQVKNMGKTRGDFLISSVHLDFGSNRKMRIPVQPFLSNNRSERLKTQLDDQKNTTFSTALGPTDPKQKENHLRKPGFRENHRTRKPGLAGLSPIHPMVANVPHTPQKEYFRSFGEIITLPLEDPRLARLLPHRHRKSIRLYGTVPMNLFYKNKEVKNSIDTLQFNNINITHTKGFLPQRMPLGSINSSIQKRIEGPEIEPQFSHEKFFDLASSLEGYESSIFPEIAQVVVDEQVLPTQLQVEYTEPLNNEYQAEKFESMETPPSIFSDTNCHRDIDSKHIINRSEAPRRRASTKPLGHKSRKNSVLTQQLNSTSLAAENKFEREISNDKDRRKDTSKLQELASTLKISESALSAQPIHQNDSISSLTQGEVPDIDLLESMQYTESRGTFMGMYNRHQTEDGEAAEYDMLHKAIHMQKMLQQEDCSIPHGSFSKRTYTDQVETLPIDEDSTVNKGFLTSIIKNMSLMDDDTRDRLNIMAAPIFKERPLIGIAEMEVALRDISLIRKLGDQEIEYIKRVFELVNDDTVSQQEYIVIASLAERMSLIDQKIQLSFYDTDFKKLESNVKQYRKLFTVYTEEDGNMTYEDLRILLLSSGSSEQQVGEIAEMLNFKDRLPSTAVGFLDFLSYVPFFAKLHDNIVNNPFGDSAHIMG
ncbi:hypothetical protein BASA50_003693 [Batrachochytrium salamandrivorans]|uniref:EF-hand domain-containing protein n=1 Tax=Batrachochytrium salamandrivorans TaxID=1357716 RepID=A0ABQ8FL93_9FUNG|nr:hypothetical protein BASA50_003693 [Batrachochytrium salamandrivorans]